MTSNRLDKRELILAKGSEVMTRRGYHGTGVLETRGTLARIEALKRHKVLEARLADDLSESFELFLQLRLTRQLAGQRDGRQQGLDVSGMSRHDRDMLRYGLHVVKKFKQSVARQFHLETR